MHNLKNLSEMNGRNNNNNDLANEQYRIKLEKAQANQQLKVAYKSLLPNDIYKQYYNSK